MPNLPGILPVSSTEDALTGHIARQEAQIADALAPYDARSATYAWFDTLRAVRECINPITVECEAIGFDPCQLVAVPASLYDERVTAASSRIADRLDTVPPIASGVSKASSLNTRSSRRRANNSIMCG